MKLLKRLLFQFVILYFIALFRDLIYVFSLYLNKDFFCMKCILFKEHFGTVLIIYIPLSILQVVLFYYGKGAKK